MYPEQQNQLLGITKNTILRLHLYGSVSLLVASLASFYLWLGNQG
jgi:hypothetical protein